MQKHRIGKGKSQTIVIDLKIVNRIIQSSYVQHILT